MNMLKGEESGIKIDYKKPGIPVVRQSAYIELLERLRAAEDVLDYVNENLVINSAKHYRQKWPKEKS